MEREHRVLLEQPIAMFLWCPWRTWAQVWKQPISRLTASPETISRRSSVRRSDNQGSTTSSRMHTFWKRPDLDECRPRVWKQKGRSTGPNMHRRRNIQGTLRCPLTAARNVPVPVTLRYGHISLFSSSYPIVVMRPSRITTTCEGECRPD